MKHTDPRGGEATMKKSSKTAFRDGDVMIITETTTETRDAIVDYEDILDETEVREDDDCHIIPYRDWDDYDHEIRNVTHEGQRDGFGCYDDCVVILDDKVFSDVYKFYRKGGASKQVAYEKAASVVRRTTEQIVKWRSQGWEWYGVVCDFEGYGATVWGIDDYDYAKREVRLEIANEVAAQLEEDGYTVINRPEKPAWLKGKIWSRDDQRRMYQRNIHQFDHD